jgi:hypothetical protein
VSGQGDVEPDDYAGICEKILLGQARELLAQPPPPLDDLWEVSMRLGKLKYYVAELAAALELRARRRPARPEHPAAGLPDRRPLPARRRAQ